MHIMVQRKDGVWFGFDKVGVSLVALLSSNVPSIAGARKHHQWDLVETRADALEVPVDEGLATDTCDLTHAVIVLTISYETRVKQYSWWIDNPKKKKDVRGRMKAGMTPAILIKASERGVVRDHNCRILPVLTYLQQATFHDELIVSLIRRS